MNKATSKLIIGTSTVAICALVTQKETINSCACVIIDGLRNWWDAKNRKKYGDFYDSSKRPSSKYQEEKRAENGYSTFGETRDHNFSNYKKAS